MQTHETYIQAIAKLALQQPDVTPADRAALQHIKLCYGAGQSGLRGVTYYNRWGRPEATAPFVEVCAFGQENLLQLACTTIHEMGHVCAGWEAGHGKGWHDACKRLGLSGLSVGCIYTPDMVAPRLKRAIDRLKPPEDGEPVKLGSAPTPGTHKGGSEVWTGPKPCTAGVGTRGGKSRGVGSGSRLRLFECECVPPVKARVARPAFDATCNCCHAVFALKP